MNTIDGKDGNFMKKSYLYAGITVLIWATLATVVKIVLSDIPNFEVLAISSVFAFVFLLIVNIINHYPQLKP